MGRGWGERPVPIMFGKAHPKSSRSQVFFSVVSFIIVQILGDWPLLLPMWSLTKERSVRNESWGKDMTTLANVDEAHDTQAPWGSVTGLGPLQSCEQGHSGRPAPFYGLSSRAASVLVL